MDFCFVLPTLKQISVVSIGQHSINTIAMIPEARDLSSCDLGFFYTREYSKFHQHIGSLSIPSHLKAETDVMLLGMFQQAWRWRFNSVWSPGTTGMEMIFDVHGVFDESSTLLRDWERNVAEANSKTTLRHLLYVACCRAMLPEITMILRKILVLSEGTEGTCLEDPHKEIVNNALTLDYKFVNVQGTTAAYKAFCSLNRNHIKNMYPQYCLSFNVNKGGVKITLHSVDFDIKTFNDCFFSLEPPERIAFAQHLLETDLYNNRVISTAFVLNALQRLESEGVSGGFLAFHERYKIVCRLLVWPFTRYFGPFITRIWEDYDLCQCHLSTLRGAMETLSDLSASGALHAELMLEIWNSIPSDQMLLIQSTLRDCQHCQKK